jgi:IS5 family transposase
MLKKESKQKDFFDSYVYERLLPEKHILLDIKSTLDFSFIDEETKDLYSETKGRPSFPPEVLFKVLFLEFFYNLSDYEAVDRIKTNILFRYFVGLGISSATPDDTTLVVFRRRLGEKRFKRLFDRVVVHAKEKGLIDGRLKIVDATHMQANIALQGAVNLLRHGRKAVVKKISKINPSEAEILKDKYVNEKRLDGPPTDEEIQKELSITKDFIEDTKDTFDREDIKELIALLETAVNQQERKAAHPKHKEPDEIISLSDKDARHGAKSKKKMFFGYKAHISMDEGSSIITSARTITGNRNEGNHKEVEKILDDDESKEITQEAVAADSLYDSYDNRKKIRSKNMRAFISSRDKGRKKNLDNFIYDNKNDTLICPEGHSPITKSRQETRDLFVFSAEHCRNCPQSKDCPKLNYGRVRVTVSDNYRLSILDNVPEKKEAFVKRKSIERKFGEAKVWHRLNKARYRERTRVAIQVFMTFIVLNIKRIVHLALPAPKYALCKTGFG